MENNLLLSILIGLAILDTLFGNRIFPSKVQVIERGTWYVMTKIHRIFFTPVKLYCNFFINYSALPSYCRTIIAFDYFPRNIHTKDTAIHMAEIYSNKISKQEEETVWSNRNREQKINTNEQLDELLQQLFKTEKIEDKLPILEKIKQLKK